MASTGLPPASAYRLGDVWTGGVTQARDTIEGAVPAHGTVVYKVRPAGDPRAIAPAVTVGGSTGMVVPVTGIPRTSTVVNRRAGALTDVGVTPSAPSKSQSADGSGIACRQLTPAPFREATDLGKDER
ncbi:hypothetical protein [Actinoplanes subtropicus]|uniref:hypothetical protein n=1 Tax=Actinoplanes subtropicus TaxID=543632 RepID=UPI003CCBF4A3